ncbi:hypothetical protein DEU56DRAFT_907434 [Suillus clintonianus]|uniref:uncharacterized protein n=1 Tax=Suillus clintonianus TaxID=1904413 RepID=UPI001B85C092|nr:uncharacterized protein DEU56DRAFT_907434 [Suillus clintonianus]KAG2153972.1 hypothetical protein DEU56DRAFT_907434 [Suillus clintonianus]
MLKLDDGFSPETSAKPTGNESLVERWILHKLNIAATQINTQLLERNFMAATTSAYNFWLYELCDVYIVDTSNLNELVEKTEALEKKISKLEKAIEKLKDSETSQEITMMTWQTADVAFNAIADFAWSHLSDAVKANLETLEIFDFSDLVYFNSRPRRFNSKSTLAAKSAYRTIHEDVRLVYVSVSELKKRTKEERHEVFHAVITAEHLEEFMKKLHFVCSGSEHPVFDHIRTCLLAYTYTVQNSQLRAQMSQ